MVLQTHLIVARYSNGTWDSCGSMVQPWNIGQQWQHKVQQYDECNMRSNIVMMGAAWCNTVRCSMMTRCNTMIGEGVTLENQLKQDVFN